jgi:16S rRNA (cytosine1402-N4)-methyltransferase
MVKRKKMKSRSPDPARRSTTHGQHRAVLLDEAKAILAPRPGQVVVDCTIGWAGHALELLDCLGPSGRLIGIDLDMEALEKARARLATVGNRFSLRQGNFAGLTQILAAEGVTQVDAILADLGMSSMQLDDPERGFSYMRDGPLDMRMDRSRGRTAAQYLATIGVGELCRVLKVYADEPEAEQIARAILSARAAGPLERTGELVQVIRAATSAGKEMWRLHPARDQWNIHPAARAFQALRIAVNRELANLEQLLRILPQHLTPGGAAAIISFHSGEDRLVKAAFRSGVRVGIYDQASTQAVRAGTEERTANPRARSAKLRWAKRA